jgi:pyridoxal 5'-phosphate synthase pdxT subunit
MTNEPRAVGILALQGDFREHREMLERMGHHAYEIRKPEQLRDLDALIIPGGESTTIARLILSNGFQEPLREFCASGRPTWGTCAGAILLAKEVDNLDRPGIETMDITVRRNAFGRQIDSFEADLDIRGVEGGPFHAVFIRAPQIIAVRRPAGAIATLADGTIVAARQGNMLATSFHPELTGDSRLHAYFLTIGISPIRQTFGRTAPEGTPPEMAPFVDRQGRLTVWPARQRDKDAAVAYMARLFEAGRRYTEPEVNGMLTAGHTFGDFTMLRRRLVDHGYLDRERNGSAYWRVEPAAAAVSSAGGSA